MQSNETTSVSDETLSSYLDHELEPSEAASVERALERTAGAQDRLQAFEDLDDLVREWASNAELSALERAVAGERRPSTFTELECERDSETNADTTSAQPIEPPMQPRLDRAASGPASRRLLVVSAALAAMAMVAALVAWLVVPDDRVDDLT